MENYAVPEAPIGESPKPHTRSHWKRSLIELNGKCGRNHLHDSSQLLMQSYHEIGAFPHTYYASEAPCTTSARASHSFPMIHVLTTGAKPEIIGIRQSAVGVSALDFDKKGVNLVSVTRSGCLTVHEFESLYCQSNKSGTEEVMGNHLIHMSISNGVNAVRWNPTNQDEVACAYLNINEVHIFDLLYAPSTPTEILRKRRDVNVHGSCMHQGLYDIALFNDSPRVVASDKGGTISMWDRRASNLPQIELTTHADGLNSIQLDGDQCVIGASKSGYIYIWDLRGGRSSTAFQNRNGHSSPIRTVNLASMLNKIRPPNAQSSIQPKEIQSIDINPSCPRQLGFHLEDGRSGVLDMHNFQVSHIHCPSPDPFTWMVIENGAIPIPMVRKPSWLPQQLIYAVGSTSGDGLHLLDFYPHTSSPCHVDYENSTIPKKKFARKENIFVPLSTCVTACATHPLNGTIVAGTLEASLLMISQKHVCKKGNDDDDDAKLSRKTVDPKRLDISSFILLHG